MKKDLEKYLETVKGSIDYNKRMMEMNGVSSKDKKEYRMENITLTRVVRNLENILNNA